MGIKGPPSLPVAFVNRAGMAEGWNVFDIVGRRAEEKGRGEIGEEIQFDGTVCPSDLLCVSATLSGTLRVCWANEWSLFCPSRFPHFIFFAKNRERGENE